MRKKNARNFKASMGMLLITFMLFITGCGKDLSGTASQMLQAMTLKYIEIQAFDSAKRLVTFDISDLSQYPTEDYQKWVKDTFAYDNIVIVLFTNEDESFTDVSDAEEYLSNNGYEAFLLSDFDWTSIRISSKESGKKIKEDVTYQIDILYPIIHVAESYEMRMKYSNETWSVEEVISNKTS